MVQPDQRNKEEERLRELESYSILDTLPEKDYDNLTAIAAQICGTQVSLVSLIDKERQWFKSRHGLDAMQTPREYAFCAHAIQEPESILIVPDARRDKRFQNNPLVTGDAQVIFYAGVPLVSQGHALGTICVIDNSPKTLLEGQVNALKALSKQVMNLLEMRRTNLQLQKVTQDLEVRNNELERFATVAAHDIKSPLNNISTLTKLLLNEICVEIKTDEITKMLELIQQSSEQLKGLVEGMLEHSRSHQILTEKKTTQTIDEFKHEVDLLFGGEPNCEITYNTLIDEICTNKTALNQILINLVGNAVKYNDKEKIQIELGLARNGTHYRCYVKDNGPGIDASQQSEIFKLFKVLNHIDKSGKRGNGIGLATVKRLTEALGGDISVESTPGKGSIFHFSLALR